MALPTAPASSPLEEALYRKITWRLIPFLMLCYVVAYLDRVNVGFAKLQMLGDLRFSEAMYGFGAGMFFIGYFFFEVPSNLILYRVGARRWIARIMISWGMVSASFVYLGSGGEWLDQHVAFLATYHGGRAALFYTLRFLLGAAEAGFYPGIILYLTQWYPSHRRARVVALFMTAIPISGIIGGPLSGWIMARFSASAGWAGWQWLFLLEAIPSMVVGLMVLLYLDDGIKTAKWLRSDERTLLQAKLDQDRVGIRAHLSLLSVLSDSRIWRMCLIYFTCAMGQYGLNFWMPTLIQAAGVKGFLNIGLFTAIPYGATIVAMLVLGRSADRHRERRWHCAGALLAGALGLLLTPLAGTHTTAAIICLTIAAAGTITAAPLFWSLPTAFLDGVGAAAGIATINSVANLGGFISPYLVGWLKDVTHTTAAGMYMTAAVVFIGALVTLSVPAKLVNR